MCISPQVRAAVAVVHGDFGRLKRADGAFQLRAKEVASGSCGQDEASLCTLSEAAEGRVFIYRYQAVFLSCHSTKDHAKKVEEVESPK
jgi:hypothetical protein